MNRTALTIKLARKHKMQTGYSNYGLCIYIIYTENQVSLKPKVQSRDEATVSWHGHLKFGTCNSGEKTKQVVLVRMVCEKVLGYI
jgi:hypothetical protein